MPSRIPLSLSPPHQLYHLCQAVNDRIGMGGEHGARGCVDGWRDENATLFMSLA